MKEFIRSNTFYASGPYGSADDIGETQRLKMVCSHRTNASQPPWLMTDVSAESSENLSPSQIGPVAVATQGVLVDESNTRILCPSSHSALRTKRRRRTQDAGST